MALPTFLAGPIIRRVEATNVTVWACFSKKQSVELVLWDTVIEGGKAQAINQEGFYAKSEALETFEVSTNFHISVITIDTSQKKLKEDTAYCYNLYFADPGSPLNNDLATLGLLNPPEEKNVLLRNVPLGYNVGRLPTIIIPAATLKNLHMLHGSCRKIHGVGDEAFRHADTIVGKTFEDLPKRPQQLLLTGDQIYADEIPKIVLPFINQLGVELFNEVKEEMAFVNSSTDIVRLPTDMAHFPPNLRQVLINESGKLTGNGIASHLLSFGEYSATYLHYWSQDVWSRELKLMLSKFRESNYSEEIGKFHYYYLVNLLKDLELEKVFELLFKFSADEEKVLKKKELTELLQALKANTSPSPTPKQTDLTKKWTEAYNADAATPFPNFQDIMKTMVISEGLPENLKARLSEVYSIHSVLEESKGACDFLECIPLARRVLANVPTYMIFDDHEITDDWNFSQFWKNRAYTSPIGTQVIRNGLMAYTIFQDWGNVPNEYPRELLALPDDSSDGRTKYLSDIAKLKGDKMVLLAKIAEYGKAISKGLKPEAPGTLSNELDTLLILGAKVKDKKEEDKKEEDKKEEDKEEEEKKEDKAVIPTPVRWHYNFQTGPAQTFVLDTRTRREYDDFTASPGLLSQQALDEQLPERIAELNLPVVFVISPVPVLSSVVMEEFAQPLVGLIEALAAGEKGVGGAPEGAISGALKRDMEAWGFSEKHLEMLLERLAKFKKVVILSGDVHFGFTAFADYWKERKVENHARIVQLTSSSLKNGWDLDFVLLKSGFAQRLLGNFDFKFEKHGWKDKTLDIKGDMAPRHRIRLRRNPVVLPRAGWNSDTKITPEEPDWAWMLQVAVDQTVFDNFELFPDLHFEIEKDLPEKQEEGIPPDIQDTIIQMGTRHNSLFKLARNRRLIWQPHIGHVFFTASAEDSARFVINHEFHYSCRADGLLNKDNAPDIDRSKILSGPFTLHSINLDVSDGEKKPPENLNTEIKVEETTEEV